MALRIFGRTIGGSSSRNDATAARERQLEAARRKAEEARERALKAQREALEAQRKAEEAQKNHAAARAALEAHRTARAPQNTLEDASKKVREAESAARSAQSKNESAQRKVNTAFQELVGAERTANEQARAIGKPEPFAATQALPDGFDPRNLNTEQRANLLGLTSRPAVTMETAALAADVRHGDRDEIVKALSGRSPDELRSIREAYLDHYGEEIDTRVTKEVGKERGVALLAGDAVAADSALIHDSLHREKSFLGIGRHDTDEEKVLETLASKPPEELAKIKADYEQRYGKPLEAELQEFLNGADAERAQAYVTGDVSLGHAIGVREEPRKAVELLRDMDPSQRKTVGEAYERKYGANLSSDAERIDVPKEQRAELVALVSGDDQAARTARLSGGLDALIKEVGNKRDGNAPLELDGDDERKLAEEVHAALEGTTPEQRAAISQEMERTHGKPLQTLLQENLPSTREREKGLALLQNGALDPLQTVRYAATGKDVDVEALREVLKPLDRGQVDALAQAYTAQYGGSLKDAVTQDLDGREALEVDMLLRGKPRDGMEALERLEEVRNHERGGWFNRAALDVFSDSGERLDKELERATVYAGLANSDGQMSADEDRQLRVLTGFGEQEVQETQESKDRVADNVAIGATTVAAVGATVLTGGAAAGIATAAVAGAAARVTAKELVGGNTYSVQQQGGQDAVIGGAEGVFSAVGGSVATRALGTAATKAGGVAVVGAASGTTGAAGVTAVDAGTWENGVAQGLQQVGANAAIGAGAGAVGGVILAPVARRVAASRATSRGATTPAAPSGEGGTHVVAAAAAVAAVKQTVEAGAEQAIGEATQRGFSSFRIPPGVVAKPPSSSLPTARGTDLPSAPLARPAERPTVASHGGAPRVARGASQGGIQPATTVRTSPPPASYRTAGSHVDESVIDEIEARGARLRMSSEEVDELQDRARRGLGSADELMREIDERAQYARFTAGGGRLPDSTPTQEVLDLQPHLARADEAGMSASETLELQTRVELGITSLDGAVREIDNRIAARLPRPAHTVRPGVENLTSHSAALRNVNRTARDLQLDPATLQRFHDRILQTPENPAALKKTMDEVWDEMLYHRPIPDDLPPELGEELIEAAARDAGISPSNLDHYMHGLEATPDQVTRSLQSFADQRARHLHDVARAKDIMVEVDQLKQAGKFPDPFRGRRPDEPAWLFARPEEVARTAELGLYTPQQVQQMQKLARLESFDSIVQHGRRTGLDEDRIASLATAAYDDPTSVRTIYENISRMKYEPKGTVTPRGEGRLESRAQRAAETKAKREQAEALARHQQEIQAQQATWAAHAEQAQKLMRAITDVNEQGRLAGVSPQRLTEYINDLQSGRRTGPDILAEIRVNTRTTPLDYQFFGPGAQKLPLNYRAYPEVYARFGARPPASLDGAHRTQYLSSFQAVVYGARHAGSRQKLNEFLAQMEQMYTDGPPNMHLYQQMTPEQRQPAMAALGSHYAGMREALDLIKANKRAVLNGSELPI